MTKELIKDKLEEILLNQNIDNPYLKIENVVDWVYGTFVNPKAQGEVDGWIDKWLELFPAGVKWAGKPLRSERLGCLKKMQKFVKDYPQYDKHTIFAATKMYLDERKAHNYDYTKAAIYFINKIGEDSTLAALCRDYVDGTYAKIDSYEEFNDENPFFI